MSIQRRRVLEVLAAGAAGLFSGFSFARTPAPLMLADVYKPGINLADYAVSEKYDGVRGYWDGKQLWTRGSVAIAAPAWFTLGWSTTPMDGELWAGRGRFQKAASTVRQQTPDEAAWREMKYMVFDLPAQAGDFESRTNALERIVGALGKSWVMPVRQVIVPDHAALQALLETTVKAGGEGLVLHKLEAAYRPGRSRDLLKFKPYDDADAFVVGHEMGRGRLEGVMGALVVETPEGVRFKLGSGFGDDERRKPPRVGSWISYRYRGETDAGVPRFATYLRMRADL